MIANIFGDWYWVVLAVIVLFGGSQLPKLARNSGEALKEFRKAHTDEADSSPAIGTSSGQSALTGAGRYRLPPGAGYPRGCTRRSGCPPYRRGAHHPDQGRARRPSRRSGGASQG